MKVSAIFETASRGADNPFEPEQQDLVSQFEEAKRELELIYFYQGTIQSYIINHMFLGDNDEDAGPEQIIPWMPNGPYYKFPDMRGTLDERLEWLADVYVKKVPGNEKFAKT